MTQEDVKKLNLNSPEGKMFNAAMAILTTEYRPDMEFGVMFDKVKALAVQLPDSDIQPQSARDTGEEAQTYWIDYGNDGGWLTGKEIVREYQELLEDSELASHKAGEGWTDADMFKSARWGQLRFAWKEDDFKTWLTEYKK